MTRNLERLLNPRSIAVIGGGAWCRAVIAQSLKMGFSGSIWPVHPDKKLIEGIPAYSSVAALPYAPDACFIGVNRHATVNIVRDLETIGAGGAICFASGFLEASAEDGDSARLQEDLLSAAGDMPLLGPNCYGFINYLDGALLWPDQHGGEPVDKGVAIVTQSSNIAINLTMQKRGLPLAFIVTAGNQAQTSLSEIASHLLADDRITAVGLHIEGFSDLRAFENLAKQAAILGKPVVVLKTGRSSQARAATQSHTASLAGGDAGAQALLDRFAIPRLNTLPEFLETLKLLHVVGKLSSNRLASISCSGGEASLIADIAVGRKTRFPALNEGQITALRAALGPMVALANPLDYHTYIWRDAKAMTQAWAAMMDKSLALTILIVDFPREDRCRSDEWECALEAALAAKAKTGANVAMVATLPELMPEHIAQRLIAGGVTPLSGLSEAIAAAEAAVGSVRGAFPEPLCLPGKPGDPVLMTEARAKSALAAFGVVVPKYKTANSPEGAARNAESIGFPVVLKGQGIAHKSDVGAVVLNLTSAEQVKQAAMNMVAESFLVEEMIEDGVVELLIGVVRDPAHGFVLTLAAGGVLTELLEDSASVLIPSHADVVADALGSLKIAKLLAGYRGKPAANIPAIVSTIMSVQDYVLAHADLLDELEINPLLCCPTRAIAADALIRQEEP